MFHPPKIDRKVVKDYSCLLDILVMKCFIKMTELPFFCTCNFVPFLMLFQISIITIFPYFSGVTSEEGLLFNGEAM